MMMMMMDFWRCKKSKNDFCNLPGVTKLIINEQDVTVRTCKKLNVPCRNCMKTKKELEEAIKDTITKYKEIIFGPDTPACMACLNELRKHQAIDKKVYDQSLMDDMVRKLAWEGLQKNIVMDGDRMIDKRTGEVLGPKVDSMYWKKF